MPTELLNPVEETDLLPTKTGVTRKQQPHNKLKDTNIQGLLSPYL